MSAAPMLSALIPTAPGTRLTVEESVQRIHDEVYVSPLRNQEMSHLAVNEAQWGWEQLRDYVITEMIKIQGIFPRDANKEMGIFKAFVSRYPDGQAAQIARYAFQVAGGYWKNAPISVSRFCKNSDQYFGDVILRHLEDVARAHAARV